MINNNITEQFHNASEYNNKKFGYASCFIFTQMEKKKHLDHGQITSNSGCVDPIKSKSLKVAKMIQLKLGSNQ